MWSLRERKVKNDFSDRLIQVWVISFCLVTSVVPITSWPQSCHPAAVFHNLKRSWLSGCVWVHRHSKELTSVTASCLWVHSPEILICYFFPLHKQYKEVDRSERGLCEKIIKSFRECQESIAQHCQHSGVLQAIIRWHGGVRHVWQLIPAWSPTEKQRAASRRHQAKWWIDVLESDLSRVSLFSQVASFGEELFSLWLASAWIFGLCASFPKSSWLWAADLPSALWTRGHFCSASGHSLLHDPVLTLNSRTFKLIKGRASCSLIRGHFSKNSGKGQGSLSLSGAKKTKGITGQD